MNILRWSDCVDLMSFADGVELSKRAFEMLSTPEQSEVPERHILELAQGRFTVMTAATYEGELAGAKLLTVFPGNLRHGFARINGLVVLIDPETGLIDTLIDGTWLTAFRTGTACGASVDLLARPDSRTIAVFGAGPVAYMAILATAAVRSIDEIRICNRQADQGEKLVRKIASELSLVAGEQIQRVADSAQAISGVDIIITATSSARPVFPDSALASGVHIAAMGGGYPHHELEAATMRRASVFVDSLATAAAECGDVCHAWGKLPHTALPVVGELGSIALGNLPGRTSREEITVFESCGSAVQDLVTGDELARRARAECAGTQIELFHAREIV